jgi:pyruvate/2-oxoglutarate dehydrogenase complex dihydrolipoamide dehydrogenase (E3) component
MAQIKTGIKTDICVIGAGSGGLSVAAGAAQMGASTVLIERGAMGGDCLNYGCVPSKSMIAAGRAADTIRHAGRFGVNGHEPEIDFASVYDHIHGVISAIAPNDSVERFEGLGVKVIRAGARFTGPDTVEADGTTIKARRFVLATGSRAAHPSIPGLDDVPFLTNETIFERKSAPEHLIVIGGGPIGMEMAQAHRRLGADVTVLQKGAILPKDDPDLVTVIRNRLTAEGVDLRENVGIARIERHGNGIAAVLSDATRIEGSDLLVAAGRQASVDGLGLEAAGIEFSPKGVKTDDCLRTTNRRVFAVGDVAGGPQFTHIAGYHAGIVIRNILFRLPAKVDYSALPWVTYTDPELAHVGLTEAQAREAHKDVTVLTWEFEENDRAQAERDTEGKVKVLTLPNGRILGASIVGPHAGELIQVWCLAISQKLKIGAIASMIAPYPTLGEAGKRAAGAFYTPKLFNGRTRGLVRFLSWFG